MDTRDKLIGIAMILAGIAFIVLGSAFLVRTNIKVDVYGNQEQNSVTTDNLNIWNGIYKNENATITIYRRSKDNLEVLVNVMKAAEDGGINSTSGWYSFDLNSDTKLVYNKNSVDVTDSITIERNDTGIVIQSSSTKQDDILNIVNGNYQKQEYKSYGWNGVYTNGDKTITIAEMGNGTAYISILKGFSSFMRSIKDVTEQTINYEDESFGDIERINITKTADGIAVTASDTDSDGTLNSISGNYTK